MQMWRSPHLCCHGIRTDRGESQIHSYHMSCSKACPLYLVRCSHGAVVLNPGRLTLITSTTHIKKAVSCNFKQWWLGTSFTLLHTYMHRLCPLSSMTPNWLECSLVWFRMVSGGTNWYLIAKLFIVFHISSRTKMGGVSYKRNAQVIRRTSYLQWGLCQNSGLG